MGAGVGGRGGAGGSSSTSMGGTCGRSGMERTGLASMVPDVGFRSFDIPVAFAGACPPPLAALGAGCAGNVAGLADEGLTTAGAGNAGRVDGLPVAVAVETGTAGLAAADAG